MSKGLNIPEGTTVYIPAVRNHNVIDGENIVCFTNDMGDILLNDDQFLTEEELKAKFNEGLPKQGEMIEGSNSLGVWGTKQRFITYYQGKYITVDDNGYYSGWSDFRIPQVVLTLAEVEEKLGMEKGSLIIKD